MPLLNVIGNRVDNLEPKSSFDPASFISWDWYGDMTNNSNDGSNVDAIFDQIGSNDLTQNSGALAPEIVTNAEINGLQTARFKNDSMTWDSPISRGGTTDRFIMLVGDCTEYASNSYLTIDLFASNQSYEIAVNGLGTGLFLGRNSSGSGGSYTLSGTFKGILFLVYRSGTIYAYDNGTFIGSYVSGTITNDIVSVGGYGDIYAHGFMIDNIPTDSELNALGNYYEGLTGVPYSDI